MMRFTFLFFLLLASSCTKNAELTAVNGGYQLKNVKATITKLKEAEWLVGEKLKFKISKGLRVDLNPPHLKDSSLKELFEKRSADTWLFRIFKKIGNRRIVIGNLRVPFMVKHKMGPTLKVIEEAYFQLNYSGAAVTAGHIEFKCPPLNHQYKFKSYHLKNIAKSDLGDSELKISMVSEKSGPRKYQMFSFRPAYYDAGRSLAGEYFVEVALFSSSKNLILSSFYKYPQKVVIADEVEMSIPGCGTVWPLEGVLFKKSGEFRWNRK